MLKNFLQWLELKTAHYTVYPSTTSQIIKRFFKRAIAPFRKIGGYCDWCGKFRLGLKETVIDADYEPNEDGGVDVIRYYGWVCGQCYNFLENFED